MLGVDALVPLSGAALTIGGWFVLGLGILATLPHGRVPRAVRCAAAFAIGAGSAALFLFVANQGLHLPLTPLLGRALLGTQLLCGTLLLSRSGQLARPTEGAVRAQLTHALQRLRAAPAHRTIILAAVGLFVALTWYERMVLPPLATDDLVYQLALAPRAFVAGGLSDQVGPTWPQWSVAYPPFYELQQLATFLVIGSTDERAIRPLLPIQLMLWVGVVWAIGARLGHPLCGLWGVLLLGVNPEWGESLVRNAEIPLLLGATLGTYGLVALCTKGRTDDAPSDLAAAALCGLGGGIAAFSKYNGLVLCLALLVSLVVLLHRARPRPGVQRPLRLAAVGCTVAGALALPVLVRNWLVFGNPTYPLLWETFGGTHTDLFARTATTYDPAGVLVVRLFAVTVLGSYVPLLLALGMLLVWSARRQPMAVLALPLLLYLLVFSAIPFRGSFIRYLAPLMGLIAPLAGAALGEILVPRTLGRWPRRHLVLPYLVLGLGIAIAAGALASVRHPEPYVMTALALGLLGTASIATSGIFASLHGALPPRLVGTGRRPALPSPRLALALTCLVLALPSLTVMATTFPPSGIEGAPDAVVLEDELGDDYRMWVYMNANLPDDATVVTFEPRTYYLHQRIIDGGSPELAATFGTNATVALQTARDVGVDYVLQTPWVDRVEAVRPLAQRSLLFHALDDPEAFLLIHQQGQVRLYALR